MKNRNFFIFLFFIFCQTLATAQWYNPDKVNKKAGEIYAKAYDEAQAGNYKESLKHIEDALKIDNKFVDAYLSRASVYAELKNYTLSVADFEKAFILDSFYSKTYLLPYSISLAGIGKFDRALQIVNQFLQTPNLNKQSIKAGNYRKSTYQFAIDYAIQHQTNQYVFKPQNLGDSINTSDLEYFPTITIDGNKMIFCRRIASDEDFYESNLVNGVWSKAKPLAGKINTTFNEGAENVSLDGQLLIFTGCGYPEGLGSCDLYFSQKTKNGWSEAQNMGSSINTEYWETSPSLSPDKRDLYFASDRPGGFGGSDIYVVHRLPNGKWSKAENLGEAVNTSGDESCPFMHTDNATLYFNSTGHMGYGSADLFYSKKITDSTWSVAENLGYPINTIDNEGSLIVAANASTAYYASDKENGKGGLDIYSFELRNDIKPDKTLWVKGKITDAKTKKGLPCLVELTNVKTNQLISKLQTDEDGNYITTLPIGSDYAFNVNRKGYLFYSDNFSLTKNVIDSVYEKNISLNPIEANAQIILKNIFFDTKKYDLKPSSISELNKVVQLLNDNLNLKIMISGHTDNVGLEKDNLTLSNNRAKAVVNFLIAQNINAKRLSYKGFGSTKPITSNNLEQGKATNRRTELSVLSN